MNPGKHRTVISLFTVLNDVGGVLIEDDKYDIGKFGSEIHPSRMHHWQVGSVMQLIGQFGMKALSMLDNMMAAEEKENSDLRKMQLIMMEQNTERQKLIREYIDLAFGKPKPHQQQQQQQKTTMYMGNIDQLKPNRPKPLPAKILSPPRPPKLG